MRAYAGENVRPAGPRQKLKVVQRFPSTLASIIYSLVLFAYTDKN